MVPGTGRGLSLQTNNGCFYFVTSFELPARSSETLASQIASFGLHGAVCCVLWREEETSVDDGSLELSPNEAFLASAAIPRYLWCAKLIVQDVTWIVLNEPILMGKRQLDEYRRSVALYPGSKVTDVPV